jgi:iron complex transport system ATP-binding protein
VGLGGFSRSIGLWDKSDEDRVIIQEALEQFEIQNLRGRDYRSLSGGERQRARLASLMVQDPNLFLWDEPLENLDYSGRAKLLSWVAEMTKTAEKASMMVMHDINLANLFFTHLLMLFEDGTCLSGTSEDLLTVKNLETLYRTQFDQVISQDRRLFLPRFR